MKLLNMYGAQRRQQALLGICEDAEQIGFRPRAPLENASMEIQAQTLVECQFPRIKPPCLP
jgi:hypothetical protein